MSGTTKDAFDAYYALMEGLAAKLMGPIALGLGLDERWFDDKIADHITGLVALHYRALDSAPLPG